MKLSSNTIIGILILFYAVGVVGMFTPYRELFLALTPFHLGLSFVCFMLAHSKWSSNFILDIVLIFLVSFGAEWIGVHTGYLFGAYAYGPNLGVRFDGIPILIGVNWLMLSYGSASLVRALHVKGTFAVLFGALLMTGLDWLMEPVAVKSGFWHWKNGVIPLFNYVCWFGLSFLFQCWISYRKTAVVNKVWTALFILMVVFFAILN